MTLHNGLQGWPIFAGWLAHWLAEIQPSKVEFVVTNHTPVAEIRKMRGLLKGLKGVSEMFVWMDTYSEEAEAVLEAVLDETDVRVLTTTVFSERQQLVKKMGKL
jgi:transcriptional regulator with PAS, ATPase and Fis domain